jgi:capsular exopolysaccharide synthesis family protein
VRGLEAEAPAWASRSSDPLLSKLQLLKSRGLVGRVVDEHGLRLRLSASKIPGLQLAAASTDRAAPADTLRLAFGDSNVSVSNRAGARGVAPYGKPIVVGGVRLAVAAHPGVQSGSLAMLPREATIDSVLAGLRVSPRADTDVIDVSYLGPQPAVAQGVVNRLSELFAEMDVQAAQEQSRRRRVFLEGQLRETDAALASAQQALDSYRRGQPAYSSREQMAAQQNALVALDIRREEIDADRRMSQALLERLERYQGGAGAEEFHALVSSPDVSGNPVVAQLLQRLVQYQTERDSLTTGEWRSAAASPEVVRLTELITATQAQVVGAVRSQILGLEARIASLTDLRNRMAASAVLPSEESKETRLAEQVAASRAIADDIRQEYQKARMSEAAAIGQVQVLDLAALPEHPAKSLRSMKLGLGLLLGLLAGVGGATLREAADGSVRRREEVESHMQLPVLAVIPRITTAGRLVTLGRAALPASTGADPAVTQPAPIRNLRALASRWTAPREERNQAAAREAQRMLRNNLAWAAGTTNGPTIIVVTSAAAGEGKTTTAVNLALGYVREGKSTILLDCDLRRPRLHDYFHIAQSPGLGQLLLGHADLPSVVRASHVPGLSVVPAGHLAVDAFDGVNVDRFRHTLHQLAGRYERVVIDTPPVLAVADAAMLASLGDGVVVVVRAGETDRVAVEQSLRQLAFVGARIMGVVLNDAGGELERYGRYSPVRAYGVGEA